MDGIRSRLSLLACVGAGGGLAIHGSSRLPLITNTSLLWLTADVHEGALICLCTCTRYRDMPAAATLAMLLAASCLSY